MASFLDQVGIWPYLLTILPYLLFLWVVSCHVYPVYRASQRRQRTRTATLAGILQILALFDYPMWVLGVWFTATVSYLIICFIFALLASGIPSSGVNEVRAHLTECANRFRIQRCNDPNQPGWVCSFLERECWALAMCISSPIYLLVIQEILQEFGHQLWSTLYWFLFLVSLYVLLCATFPDDVAVGAPPSPGAGPGPGPGPPQVDAPVLLSPGLVPIDSEAPRSPLGPHILPPSYETNGFLPIQYMRDNDLFVEHLRRDEAHIQIRAGLRAAPNETYPDRMRDTRGIYFHVRRATDRSIVTRQEMNRILFETFVPEPANENPVPDANGEGSSGAGRGTAQGPPYPALPSAFDEAVFPELVLPIPYLQQNGLVARAVRAEEAHLQPQGALRFPMPPLLNQMYDENNIFFHIHRITDGSIVTRVEMNRVLAYQPGVSLTPRRSPPATAPLPSQPPALGEFPSPITNGGPPPVPPPTPLVPAPGPAVRTPSPAIPPPNPGPPIPLNLTIREHLQYYRMALFPYDSDRGPGHALPVGDLTVGNGDPSNHLVDSRGSRFRVRGPADTFVRPEIVLAVLRTPVTAGQPRQDPPLDVSEAQRAFLQTETAQAHGLVQQHLYPLPVLSFLGQLDPSLPVGMLIEDTTTLPPPGFTLGMVDARNVGYIVFDEDDRAVHPNRVREAQNFHQRRQTLAGMIPPPNTFLEANDLVTVRLRTTARGGHQANRPYWSQGMLRSVSIDNREVIDETGAHFRVYRRADLDRMTAGDPLTVEAILQMQAEFLGRGSQAQPDEQQNNPSGGTPEADNTVLQDPVLNANANGEGGVQEDPPNA